MVEETKQSQDPTDRLFEVLVHDLSMLELFSIPERNDENIGELKKSVLFMLEVLINSMYDWYIYYGIDIYSYIEGTELAEAVKAHQACRMLHEIAEKAKEISDIQPHEQADFNNLNLLDIFLKEGFTINDRNILVPNEVFGIVQPNRLFREFGQRGNINTKMFRIKEFEFVSRYFNQEEFLCFYMATPYIKAMKKFIFEAIKYADNPRTVKRIFSVGVVTMLISVYTWDLSLLERIPKIMHMVVSTRENLITKPNERDEILRAYAKSIRQIIDNEYERRKEFSHQCHLDSKDRVKKYNEHGYYSPLSGRNINPILHGSYHFRYNKLPWLIGIKTRQQNIIGWKGRIVPPDQNISPQIRSMVRDRIYEGLNIESIYDPYGEEYTYIDDETIVEALEDDCFNSTEITPIHNPSLALLIQIIDNSIGACDFDITILNSMLDIIRELNNCNQNTKQKLQTRFQKLFLARYVILQIKRAIDYEEQVSTVFRIDKEFELNPNEYLNRTIDIILGRHNINVQERQEDFLRFLILNMLQYCEYDYSTKMRIIEIIQENLQHRSEGQCLSCILVEMLQEA